MNFSSMDNSANCGNGMVWEEEHAPLDDEEEDYELTAYWGYLKPRRNPDEEYDTKVDLSLMEDK